MSYIVDTNVLLRSVQDTHPMHEDAASGLSRGEAVFVLPQNLMSFG